MDNTNKPAQIQMSYICYESEKARYERIISRLTKLLALESALMASMGIILYRGIIATRKRNLSDFKR